MMQVRHRDWNDREGTLGYLLIMTLELIFTPPESSQHKLLLVINSWHVFCRIPWSDNIKGRDILLYPHILHPQLFYRNTYAILILAITCPRWLYCFLLYTCHYDFTVQIKLYCFNTKIYEWGLKILEWALIQSPIVSWSNTQSLELTCLCSASSSFVTLGSSFNLSGPQFPQLYSVTSNNTPFPVALMVKQAKTGNT